MAAAADLHDHARSGVSPELVLVDAELSAEVRHLLVLPEDTLERLLERKGDGCRPGEVASLPEPADYGKSEDAVTDYQALAETSEGDRAEPWQHPTDWAGTSPPAPHAEQADPVLVKDVVPVDPAVERIALDQGQHPSNTYPTLPAPPPEDAQEDATDVVLRLITRTP